MYLGTFIPTDQQAANYFSGDEPLPSASWLTILCYEVHSLSILLCFSGWRSSVPLVSGGIWTFWWVIQSEVRVSLRIVVLCMLVASVIVERKRSRGWCLDYCDVCASPVPDGEAPIKEAKAKEQRVFGPLAVATEAMAL